MKFASSLSQRGSAFLGLALLLWAGAASAQMYKWVDANGKTHFTDTPPPATAKAAPIKSSTGAASGAGLPYALATAVRNAPVVLWTTNPCPSCDSGRAFLKGKGIPFTEKTVTSDADETKLRESGGDERLPALFVGRNKVIGYQQGAWGDALSAASYPDRAVLPANYQNGMVSSGSPRSSRTEPDAEAMRAAAAAAAAEEEEQRKKRAAAPTAPPGFQF
jgi:glutaredoxin